MITVTLPNHKPYISHLIAKLESPTKEKIVLSLFLENCHTSNQSYRIIFSTRNLRLK